MRELTRRLVDRPLAADLTPRTLCVSLDSAAVASRSGSPGVMIVDSTRVPQFGHASFSRSSPEVLTSPEHNTGRSMLSPSVLAPAVSEAHRALARSGLTSSHSSRFAQARIPRFAVGAWGRWAR